jgi:hypothetical protein
LKEFRIAVFGYPNLPAGRTVVVAEPQRFNRSVMVRAKENKVVE